MNKLELYKKLDIDKPEEFLFFENLSALIEEENYIEEELISELFCAVDKKLLTEFSEMYFENILKYIPDEETDLYITFDSIGRSLIGSIDEDMTTEDIDSLASEFARFRKWFAIDYLVFDRFSNSNISVRDAVYNILAAKFLGDKTDYDFGRACDYPLEKYEVRLSGVVE